MIFTPYTEEELIKSSLLEEGIYKFEVISSQDTISQAGNEMITLLLKVFGNDGKEYFIKDYLLISMKFKLIHFADCTGLLETFNEGKLLSESCFGKTGLVKIAITEAKGDFRAKNEVKDYIVKSKQDKVFETKADEFLDDAIPF